MSTVLQSPGLQSKLRTELVDRRARLESTIAVVEQPDDLLRLLGEVDSALRRFEEGTYGVCAVCAGEVEAGDLLANPAARYCLCAMSPERQRALERDLDLAWHVQSALLPPLGFQLDGWQTHYRYLPHGPVSGDYCDLIPAPDGAGLYFMLGDVSGKGVAASLLMSHLNAALRALAGKGLPPSEIIGQANCLLMESTLPSQYATLVCGRAQCSGEIELVNAGHCAPVVIRANGTLESPTITGLPLGLRVGDAVCASYTPETVCLRSGDVLFLFTDGLTEAANAAGEEYGDARFRQALRRFAGKGPRDLVTHCVADLAAFLQGAERSDDLTVLALGYGCH
jgi:sigma-B regulation protein RsbU (phosphoserine phosphatase)